MKEQTIAASLSGLIQNIGSMIMRVSSELAFGFEDVLEWPIADMLMLTHAFVKKINPKYQKYIVIADPDEPENNTELRVRIANLLSIPGAHEEFDSGLFDSGQHLVSIFDSVNLSGDYKTKKSHHYLPLKTLSLNQEHIFPQLPNAEAKDDYDNLVSGLLHEAKRDFVNPESYIENLLAAFQKYTWCVPYAVNYGFPDISLYDHARMTAALAVCLTDFENVDLTKIFDGLSNNENTKDSKNQIIDQPIALLVGGDISGIQNFIYTLTAKRAAKTLRGRSFYLQLLTEALLRFILRSLNLPYTNVIYSGGGHFFILTPVSAEKDLPGIQKEISQKLLEFHGTSLYLALGWTHVPIKGFSTDLFTNYWEQMHLNLHKKKHQRYTELSHAQLYNLFTPSPQGGNEEKICEVCNREHPSVVTISGSEEGSGKIRICSLCRSFADEIGKELPPAEFVGLGFFAPAKGQDYTALGGLAEFGMQVRFDDSKFVLPIDHKVVWKISDTSLSKNIQKNSIVWQHYVVNELPLDETSQVVSFDTLQEKAHGIHRLGVLRMDIDHLGKIFKQGLKNDQGKPIGSLVHLSTLSFQISLFFEGFIKSILGKPEFKGLIYSVYSGGDDLFLVGPWHIMPDVALAIVEALNSYTGGNPDIHLSGGLSFIHGKYPIHAAAEDAGDLERAAKTAFGFEKNAFAFLGEVWHWEAFKEVKKHKEQLVRIVDDLKGPKSLLHLLQQLDEMQIEANRKNRDGKPVWGSWMWMGDYQICRMKNRAKGELKNDLESLHEGMKSGEYPYAELHDWALAARWAELELK